MARYRLYFLAVIPLFLISFTSFGQAVSNINARIDDQNPNIVHIFYDLQGKVGEKFRIEILSSKDNYQGKLQMVSGDIGENQVAGNGKRIIWRAKEELGFFDGEITFEIRSTITFSQFKIIQPTAGSTFKPGATLPIRWDGGAANSTIQLELYKLSTLSRSIGTTSNTKLYNWTVPGDVTKGTDYNIRMFDTSDPVNTTITSASFRIKGKGGAGKFVLIGVLVAGGVGAALALSGGDDVVGTTLPPVIETNPLPEPPDPSGGLARLLPALFSIRIGH